MTTDRIGRWSVQGASDAVKAAVIAGVFGIVIAIIGAVAGWLDYRGPGSADRAERIRTVVAGSASKSSIKGFSFHYPRPDGSELVPQCITAQGSGSVAEGKALVIASQEQGDDRIYFEGTVSWNQKRNQWSAELSLGDPRSSVGHLFRIYGIVLDAELSRYLAGTAENGTDTYWSSEELPPGSYEADQVMARRSSALACKA
jgi:hypothetical protein